MYNLIPRVKANTKIGGSLSVFLWKHRYIQGEGSVFLEGVQFFEICGSCTYHMLLYIIV